MAARVLVFDLDGTLVDTAPDLMHATNHVLTSLGRRPISMDEVRAFVGHGARALIARGLEATGEPVAPRALEALYQKFLLYYSSNIAVASAPFPGLMALLKQCKAAGIAMGVCTNKLEGLSVQLLDALDMTSYFTAIVGSDTLGISKPDPAPYFETLRRLGAEDAPSIMIGDSETDIKTARAAGVPVITVSFGYTAKPVHIYSPDHVVDHFAEMWPLIEATFARADVHPAVSLT
jgi:phosphoglycolate phosphatase